MTLNQQYKQYKADGGTKSFAQFAELENAKKGHLNTIGNDVIGNLNTSKINMFREPTAENEEQKETVVKATQKRVFGINKTVLYISGALLLIAIGATIYKNSKK